MLRSIPLHPILLTAYPVLFLYMTNLREARIEDVIRPLLALILIFFLLFMLLRFVLRDATKAALITSLCATLFFIYGPAFNSLEGVTAFGVGLGRHRIFFPIWCLATASILIALLRTRRNMYQVSRYFDFTGVALISIVLIQGVIGHVSLDRTTDMAEWSGERLAASDVQLKWQGKGPQPDIYYIVLDAFARKDVLNDYYGFDPTPFFDQLEQRGFYVASESKCNYFRSTYRSLASSLNMDYLDSLTESAESATTDKRLLGKMIRDNRINHQLKRAGYHLVFFRSGFQATDQNPLADTVCSSSKLNLNEFENTLIRSSVAGAFRFSASTHRKRVDYTFNQLQAIPQIKKPTFTFAHIVCPHSPYVFDADGNMPKTNLDMRNTIPQDDYVRLYVGQVEYVTRRILEVIDTILDSSDAPPIIILQSDHGPNFRFDVPSDSDWLNARTGILNAYYFPGHTSDKLYDSISPVNTFRLMLNEYFGAKYETMPDLVHHPISE